MSLEDYYKMFEVTWMNLDPSSMDSHYFLRLDDDGKSATKSENGGWIHELTISSTMDQEVYVVAHTWDSRAYSPKCLESAYNAGNHALRVGWDNTGLAFFHGSAAAPRYLMQKDETAKVSLELNFGPEEAKDWSIVAYGAKGPVGVYHSGDLVSATMPLLADPNADLPIDKRPPPPKPAPLPPPKKPTVYAMRERNWRTNSLEYDILEWDPTLYEYGDTPGCMLGIKETPGWYYDEDQ